MSETKNAAYYIARATACFRLARDIDIDDEETARNVRELGFEFAQLALECGADPATVEGLKAQG